MDHEISLEHETRAVVDHVHNSTFRLIDRTDPSMGGTCVSIKIGSRFFLATAAHVIPPTHEYEVVLRHPHGNCVDHFVSEHRDEQADVGLLELDPQKAQSFKQSFLPGERILTSLDQKREWGVLIVGYPGEYLTQIHQERLAANALSQLAVCNAFTYSSSTLPLSESAQVRLDRQPDVLEHDIFIYYDPEHVLSLLHRGNAGISPPRIKHAPPHMAGMSGGGIWLEPERTRPQAGIWTPSARLVALQVGWKPQDQWLRGTLIAKWLDLVEKNYPDLANNVSNIRKQSERSAS